jgi:hypothetical protein
MTETAAMKDARISQRNSLDSARVRSVRLRLGRRGPSIQHSSSEARFLRRYGA